MQKLSIILFLSFLFGSFSLAYSQEESTEITIKNLDSIPEHRINPLAPAKAAFYSAVLPGLGQAYNKKYWKIPIIYGALATSLYFYADNNQLYNEFRDIYKRRLEGYTDDKYQGIYSDDVIINAQKNYQRNRDLSLLITFGIYALNIIDANVDAHLIQFNVNDKLSVKPDVKQNFFDNNYNVGLTLNYNF